MSYDDDIDPFEARLAFVEMLGKVTAASQSTQRPAHFAMKHSSLYEDLYQCIQERLDSVNLSARANLLGVIDTLCMLSLRSSFTGYLDLIAADLDGIFSKVLPKGKDGDMNVVAVKQIVEAWKRRGLFKNLPAMGRVEDDLAGRTINTEGGNAGMRDTDILRRIEEDRERHKRTKEEIWLQTNESEGAEFEAAWETTSDLGEGDAEAIRAENRRYIPDYPWQEDFTAFLRPPPTD
ncbi:hypothetical protein IWQ60_005301 [Tieghemiomyces parasiticus]|uniref:CID domain-containing protein n=1 Tax=Tieghemiomyces parasiticus TaxID=78921 RepID=A0A9W8DYK8_9FUNG|nr:hypothetical protein IWQ60_005301 [Tieghemiomyces parasiticus]